MKNNGQIKIMIPEEVKQKYKILCAEKGTTMSDDLKRYITKEIKKG